jgi:hypothetical protein
MPVLLIESGIQGARNRNAALRDGFDVQTFAEASLCHIKPLAHPP